MDPNTREKELLVGQVESYFPGMEARTNEIIQAAKGKKPDADFQSLKPSPEQSLRDLALKLEEEAKVEKTAKSDEYEQEEKSESRTGSKKALLQPPGEGACIHRPVEVSQ